MSPGPDATHVRTARVAFASSYPPQPAGVATFTEHLARITPDREVVALDPAGERPAYSIEVHHRIRVDDRPEFTRVARALSACVDVASIQHDPVSWGPDDGEAVLDFLDALPVPAVTTLHDIPGAPSPHQRAILLALIRGSATTVAQSEVGRHRLATLYGADRRRLDVIPHGVPDLPMTGPEATDDAAERLGIAGLEVILEFGFLHPEKGTELTIEAMPEILAHRPAACHIVVGVIRPDEVERHGWALRKQLLARADALRVADRVRFVDRFVGRTELTRWLQAATVVVMPHQDRDRVSSGSLGYAMGAGRPIVAAPSPIAGELLRDHAGIVLAERTPAALAATVVELLREPERRRALGEAAHERSRAMTWSTIGPRYQALFDRVGGSPIADSPRRGELPRRPARLRGH